MLIVCLQGHDLECGITRKRATKCGDFRPARDNQPPRITVNGDSNRFAFLLTLIHEVAHFSCTSRLKKQPFFNQGSTAPDLMGKEWKKRLTQLMQPLFSLNIFPVGMEKALVSYFRKTLRPASSSSDARLQRLLQGYDPRATSQGFRDTRQGLV